MVTYVQNGLVNFAEKTAPPPSQSPPAAARVDEDIRQVTVKIGSSITTGGNIIIMLVRNI